MILPGNCTFYSNFPTSYDPLTDEKTVLKLWSKKKIFHKVLQQRRDTNDGIFSIHWGPPFPTGFPHRGNMLNAVTKDIIIRYNLQKNLNVNTQFGWDCHGLSVEHEVDKKLGIKSLEDIKTMGVTAYSEQCRKCVKRHQDEWKNAFERLCLCVDLENAYSTMDMEYMESVWKVFKQLFDKGLVYRDTKVLPHSTACFSHLSNFEAEQNWRETNEKEFLIAVDFTEVGEKLLICTTAPWTLVDSPMICINPSSTYAKVKLGDGDQVYIVSRDRVEQIFNQNYTVVETIQGRHLLQLHFRPILPYRLNNLEEYPIIENGSIETDVGTGIVALSPYFNEDHYSACLKLGLALPEDACPIDESGRFKETIPQLCNLSTSEADEVILKCLQEQNRVVQLKDVKMKKPYCWRSDVPLINRVASSWFIPVKQLSSKLAEKKSQLNWVDGEPNNDLSILIEKSIDWPIGRKKFWGTPIPIWSSPSGDEIRCIGSIDELLQLSGKTSIPDLHREHLEYIKIPSSIPDNPPLRRITDVFDCWFESAVMPFICNRTQADLIVEGLDQSCGWFYTTLVLSAALDQPTPSKNILSHCLVKSADGLKLSKRSHNKYDPIHMIDKCGIDPVRFALVQHPLVNDEDHVFKVGEMQMICKDIFCSITELFSKLLAQFSQFGKYSWSVSPMTDIDNHRQTFDLWMFSRMESTMRFYYTEMNAYRLHSALSLIMTLLNDVLHWFVPIRSSPVVGELYYFPLYVTLTALYNIVVMLSPFTPLFAENMYQLLQADPEQEQYFHERLHPGPGRDFLNPDIEEKVEKMRTIIELVRTLRSKHVILIQYRIDKLTIIHPSESYYVSDISLDAAIAELNNVHEVKVSQDGSVFGAILKARLKVHSSLRATLSRSEFKRLAAVILTLSPKRLKTAVRNMSLQIGKLEIPMDDIEMFYEFSGELDKNVAVITKGPLLIVIQMCKDLSYYVEGARFELIKNIRKERKKANIFPNEEIIVYCSTKDECLQRALAKFPLEICERTSMVVQMDEDYSAEDMEIVSKATVDIKGANANLKLFRKPCL